MDPERSTELLWGRARRGLNLEQIVRVAIELADAEGLDAVAMRRVAERLGFTTMALYRHLPGKAELVDLMRDEVMGEWSAADGVDHQPDWRADLESWARAGLALYRRHPWLLETTGRWQVPGPNALAAFERALGAAAGAGLRPAQVVAVVSLVGGFVESAARQIVETARTERQTGISAAQWWGARDSLFAHLDRYPTLTGIYQQGGYDAPLDPFEFGLQRVLDGIAPLVRDEMRDEKRCAVCASTLDVPSRGRPPDYCSRACQQRAYRKRRG